MRIIAGTYRSRLLKSLKGQALRPTSDRLRETLFNVLGPSVVGARFVDVFAGTGAVGIEALSRGAADIVFIENHAPAAALIRRNLETLDVRSGTTILMSDAVRGLEMLASRNRPIDAPFDYVFVDPPYASSVEYSRVLRFLGTGTVVAPNGIVIVEHRHNLSLPEHVGELHRVRILKQGDAALSFFRRSSSADEIGSAE
ncbi:MAG TPA: 16S rRNA (guanine(966)-N(2))-methyltransferase RsmD [Candidatus Dormibacteraeota bacterium]|nr:16S rRNA (guanine(966)-N(2))-methyltransferase RsmD [Candidatus Dormibacteraeota bacterium]